MQGSKAILGATLVALLAALVLGVAGVRAAVDGTAVVTSPAAGARVSGNVAVTGTATAVNFQFYKLEFAAAATPGQWSVIGPLHRGQVTNGALGSWDVSGLPPGNYTLKLTVVDITGNWIETSVPLVVAAPLARTAVPTSVLVPVPQRTASATPTPTPSTSPTAAGSPTVTPTPPATRTPTPNPTATATPHRLSADPWSPTSLWEGLKVDFGGLGSFFVIGIAGGLALVVIALAIVLVRGRR